MAKASKVLFPHGSQQASFLLWETNIFGNNGIHKQQNIATAQTILTNKTLNGFVSSILQVQITMSSDVFNDFDYEPPLYNFKSLVLVKQILKQIIFKQLLYFFPNWEILVWES